MIVIFNKEEKFYSSAEAFKQSVNGPASIIADFDEKDIALNSAGITLLPVFTDIERRVIRFESGDDYDYISLFASTPTDNRKEPFPIEIYINKKFLIVAGSNPIIDRWRADILAHTLEQLTPPQMLSLLFNQILSRNHDILDAIEDNIEMLEERVTLKKLEDNSKDIISIRKQLLSLKRYFEELYLLIEELEENQNNLYTKEHLKVFHVQKGKANRLLNTVISLRDYLSQVHETYQNQLDIGLNNTMQFFTVVTSIILPLTLITGWYGMNLNMPELRSSITYTSVIIVSLVYVVIAVIFCKKKGWF